MCQLYGHSFESGLPLEVPGLTSVHTDPARLLPITLVELTEAPCSSRFSRRSTILEQISGGARDQLKMIGKEEKETGDLISRRDSREDREPPDRGGMMPHFFDPDCTCLYRIDHI